MTTKPGWTVPLEDGLVMRGATPDDAGPLSDYNAEVHLEPDEGPSSAFWIAEWTRDLIEKPHPSMKLDDVIVVEDSSTNQIVSSCVYFQQTWSYQGVPVPFGRPEIVSTHPQYRNRGLIRRQFELMHRWGDERGHLVQGITGIPYYYRQFGYELALEMGVSRRAAISQVPSWKDGETRTVLLRKAERSDAPLMARLQRLSKERSLIAPDVTDRELEYQLFDRDEKSAVYISTRIIEDAVGKPIGFTALNTQFPRQVANISVLEFAEPAMFRTHAEPFLKALRTNLEKLQGSDGEQMERVAVELFPGHPVLPFLGRNFVASGRNYAWYMRTPDLPKLLMLIAPQLEKRLTGTSFEGLTGDKLLNFYRTGLLLKFREGRLEAVETPQFPRNKDAAANLPDLTFLQMLFGRRSFSEIAHLLVDAYANSDEDELLMDTLFPKMSSDTRFAVS